MSPDRAQEMRRNLGTASVFAICTGAMFSSGFFLLPGIAAGVAGPAVPVVYLLASVLMLPAIFSLGELSSAIPRAGGPYLFLHRSIGSLAGLIGSFAYYLQLLLKGAFAFVGVGIYLSLIVDVPTQLVAIALIVLFTGLNLLGSKQTARTEIALVAVLLVLLTYFTAAGFLEIGVPTRETGERFVPFLPSGAAAVWAGVALVFISYGGIGQVASLAEEVKDPSRSIPRGMLIAICVSTVFYVLGTVVMVAMLPPDTLHDNEVPVAAAAAEFQALPLPVVVVVLAALAAFASTGNAAILSAARYPLALARDRLIWQRFAALGKNGVPKAAVLLTGVLLVALIIAFDVEGIAKLGSAFLLFVFLGICVAVIVFRESRSEEYRPGYRSPLYPWTQVGGVIVYLALIIESGPAAVGLLLAVCAGAVLWYHLGVRNETHRSAAIYELLARLARTGATMQGFSQTGTPVLAGTGLVQLSERAIVHDLDGAATLDDAVSDAARALTSHVGGDAEAIAEHLLAEVSHWRSPSRSNVLIAPALLEGIEQPELIVLRGTIHIDSDDYEGLITLVDDEQSSGRLLALLSELEGVIQHSDFPRVWRGAKSAQELKDALKHDITVVQSLTIQIDGSGRASALDGVSVKEADLPKGSLIVLVHRVGKAFVADGDTVLKSGDRITLVADQDAMEQLRREFTSHTS